MKKVLEYFFIAVWSASMWIAIFGGMLKGYGCINMAECVFCIVMGVLGFTVSSVALCKIEAKEGK